MNARIKLLIATAFISMSGFLFGQLETNLLPNDFEMHLRNSSGIKVIALSNPKDLVKGHIESTAQIGQDDYEDKSRDISETIDEDEPYSVVQTFLMLLAAMAIFGLYRYRLRKRD